ncbi:MAG TPA: hypothetical protein PLA68_17000 [Panacibacter sp.]|nr:hypothetical protein [Panacibacter sp.]
MKYPFLMIAFSGIICNVYGQTSYADSLNYINALNNAKALYTRFINPSTGLYNGSEYADHSYEIKQGSLFFEPGEFVNGSVVYDGILYENVRLLYDLVDERIIIKDPFAIYKLALINERLSEFTIADHKFVKLAEDDSLHSIINDGFYEVLFSGTNTVYKKQKKKIEEELSVSEGVKKSVVTTKLYFILKDKRFYSVNTKGALLSVFKNHRNDVQQFMRKNKLNFRNNRQNTIVQVTAYYDAINK